MPRQDLSRASGGTLVGRGGNTQQLGAAAKRRLAASTPGTSAAVDRLTAPKMAPWQRLRNAGIAGQGSAAGNRAALAGLNQPIGIPAGDGGGMSGMRQPMLGGGRFPLGGGRFPGGGGIMQPWQAIGLDRPMSESNDTGGLSPYGGTPGGMASYLNPDTINEMPSTMDARMPSGSPLVNVAMPNATPRPGLQGPVRVGDFRKPLRPGVNSNVFAGNGGSPSGVPVDGGQAARLAAVIARLRGGGGGGGLGAGGGMPGYGTGPVYL